MLSATRRAEYDRVHEAWTRERAEKEQLEGKLLALQAQIRELDTAILSSRAELAMLAPVNMLPDDVMVEILATAYLHHFPHCRADDGLYNTNSPIAFSQVCRRWRRLAVGMASLWTCIHVTPYQHKSYAEMAKLYLERSRNRAVSISFQCYAEPLDKYPAFDVDLPHFLEHSWPRYRASWDILLAQSHRWKHCAMYCTFRALSLEVLGSIRGRILPRLEYFAHMVYGEEGGIWTFQQFYAPNLRRVDLNHIEPGPPLTSMCRRLTELKLSVCVDIRTLSHILRQASSLETLMLKSMDLYLSNNAILLPVHLPCLRFLALIDYHEYGEGSSVIAAIFHGAPSLEELVMEDAYVVVEQLEAGQLVLPRSLRTLRCGCGLLDCVTAHLGTPRMAPELEELELNCHKVARVLRSIIEMDRSSSKIMWPSLRSLTLPSLTLEEQDALLPFVEHRARIGHPIRVLKLPSAVPHHAGDKFRAALAAHQVQVILGEHAGKPVDDWLDDWNTHNNAPVFLPWNGSMEWWDQF